MPNNIFQNASNFRIGDGATFPVVGRDHVTNVYSDSGRESQWVTLSGNTYRRFPMGDIIPRRNVSSTVLYATIENRRRETTSGTSQCLSKVIKVKKTVQYVDVLGLSGEFTSITVEPVEKDEAEEFEAIRERVCREMSSHRSALLTHLVGLGWSERLTLIIPDERVNADEFTKQIVAQRDFIVWFYLRYTSDISLYDLKRDKNLTIPVQKQSNLWTFNPRNHVWQYDLPSVSISLPSSSSANSTSFDPHMYYSHKPIPLRRDTCPHLNANEIISCIEGQFGDFLHLIASLGRTRHIERLSDFARHGFLTFGTVINRKTSKILAHFPSVPSPEWLCKSSTSAVVKSCYSTSVPWRVDLTFQNPDRNRVSLRLCLRLPGPPLRHWLAYLSQSLPFSDGLSNPFRDLVFIDYVEISLHGTFYHNPATSSTPAYLFVPPIPFEKVNDVYCIRYPLSSRLFLWCSDPNGRNIIRKKDWAKFNIPHLEVFKWIGSSWGSSQYKVVRDHLQKRNYSLDGKQYAQDYGHPELIHGDPHEIQTAIMDVPHNFVGADRPPTPSESVTAANSSYEDDTLGLIDNETRVKTQTTKLIPVEIGAAQTHETESSNEVDQEILKACNTRGTEPPCRISQFQNNDCCSLGWPRVLFTFLEATWLIAVVLFAVLYDRVGSAVRTNREGSLDVDTTDSEDREED
ncbi:hypothetical protein PM082_022909 [Marasmius tenuissimus]|nr:hypothetical protein PM082_022909 [Marasmius tenuissimus]